MGLGLKYSNDYQSKNYDFIKSYIATAASLYSRGFTLQQGQPKWCLATLGIPEGPFLKGLVTHAMAGVWGS